MIRRALAAAFLALAIGGCASAPAPNCARLAFDGWFCPLPPAALTPRSGLALITVQQEMHKSVYVGQLDVSAKALRLALANPAGVPLATVVWDGETASTIPTAQGLDPRLLVALLELAYEDPANLQSGLHGLQLSAQTTPQGEERILRSDGNTVARLAVSGDNVRILVPRSHLTVTIEPLGGKP